MRRLALLAIATAVFGCSNPPKMAEQAPLPARTPPSMQAPICARPAERAAIDRHLVMRHARADRGERPGPPPPELESRRRAAMLDPNTAASLTVGQIGELCNALVEAHGELLHPALRAPLAW